MKGILIDNWSLQNTFDVLIHNNFLSKDRNHRYDANVVEAMSVMEALILWDEIYYVDDIYITHGFASEYRKLLANLNAVNARLIAIPVEKFDSVRPDVNEFVRRTIPEAQYSIERRALEYRELSCRMGIDYYPSVQRANFLRGFSKIDNPANRKLVMNAVETEIHDFYKKVNRQLQMDFAQYNIPLLCDYAMRDASSSTDMLAAALEIKKEPAFQSFRDWTENFERALENGTLETVNRMLIDVREISAECLNGRKSKWSFSIGFVCSFIPEIVLNRDIEFKKPRLHMSFLKSLMEYGMNGRPL